MYMEKCAHKAVCYIPTTFRQNQDVKEEKYDRQTVWLYPTFPGLIPQHHDSSSRTEKHQPSRWT